MPKRFDLSGKKFNRLLVLNFVNVVNGTSRWNCLCDCGSYSIVVGRYLVSGHTKSCGCLQKEAATKHIFNVAFKHGESSNGKCTSEYNIRYTMISRCYNTNNKSYKNYGGRGITVCDRWLHSFDNFLEDMGRKPSPNHSLDRIDNNGNYCPENCRWTTNKVQSSNTRTNVKYEYEGKVLIQEDWARLLKCDKNTIKYYLKKGWSFSKICEYFILKNSISI